VEGKKKSVNTEFTQNGGLFYGCGDLCGGGGAGGGGGVTFK
jgi:hypothetical protein